MAPELERLPCVGQSPKAAGGPWRSCRYPSPYTELPSQGSRQMLLQILQNRSHYRLIQNRQTADVGSTSGSVIWASGRELGGACGGGTQSMESKVLSGQPVQDYRLRGVASPVASRWQSHVLFWVVNSRRWTHVQRDSKVNLHTLLGRDQGLQKITTRHVMECSLATQRLQERN
ncbi:hypothetical protein J6590_030577 [Homalodisca vitripennis]|nr:hypothetical protein J6590_030577 [Homalodisca vitripennis]